MPAGRPVLGTLLNFMGMRRVNTRGIKQANKHVLMASICYNMKKYLKFIRLNLVANKNYQLVVGKQLSNYLYRVFTTFKACLRHLKFCKLIGLK